jgi:hypothetical protein
MNMTRHERHLAEALVPLVLDSDKLEESRKLDRASLSLYRAAQGFKAETLPVLLTQPDGNVKLEKSERPSYSLSLSPATSGGWNVCPASTPECRAHCVAYAGKGSMSTVLRGRAWKTDALLHSPRAFLRTLVREIDKAVSKHGRIAVRLNAFSDLRWEGFASFLFTRWGDAVAFYDYTKRTDRGASPAPSYTLTHSASERTNDPETVACMARVAPVAVVFKTKRGQPLPETYGGCRVIDGDVSDFRPADPAGVVVGLRAKGSLRTSASPFAVQVD